MSRLLLFFLVLKLVFMSSCTAPLYRPITANTPIFDSSGQVDIRADLKNVVINTSITDNIFVTAQAQFFNYDKRSRFGGDGTVQFSVKNQIFLPQLGLGYFKVKNNINYTIMAGCGYGNQYYKSNASKSDNRFNYNYALSAKIFQAYLAAGMAVGGQSFRQIFQVRVTPIFYLKDQLTTQGFDEYYLYFKSQSRSAPFFNPDLRAKRSEFYFNIEPSVTLRKQFDVFYFQGQLGFNCAISHPNLEGIDYWLNFSVGTFFSELFKKTLW